MLECKVVKSRTPVNVTWELNDRRIVKYPYRDVKYKTYNDDGCRHELHIRLASVSDSGNYTCVVTNADGTERSISSIKVISEFSVSTVLKYSFNIVCGLFNYVFYR